MDDAEFRALQGKFSGDDVDASVSKVSASRQPAPKSPLQAADAPAAAVQPGLPSSLKMGRRLSIGPLDFAAHGGRNLLAGCTATTGWTAVPHPPAEAGRAAGLLVCPSPNALERGLELQPPSLALAEPTNILLAVDWVGSSSKGSWLLAAAWGPAGSGPGGSFLADERCTCTIAVWCFSKVEEGGGELSADRQMDLNGLSPPKLVTVFRPAHLHGDAASDAAVDASAAHTAPPETIVSLSWSQTKDGTGKCDGAESTALLAICQPSATSVVIVSTAFAQRAEDAAARLLCRVPVRMQALSHSTEGGSGLSCVRRQSSDLLASSAVGKSRWISCCWLSGSSDHVPSPVLILLSRSRICLVTLAVTHGAENDPSFGRQPKICDITQEHVKEALDKIITWKLDGNDGNFDGEIGDFRTLALLSPPNPSNQENYETNSSTYQFRVALTTDSPALERSLFKAVQAQRIISSEHGLLQPADLKPALASEVPTKAEIDSSLETAGNCSSKSGPSSLDAAKISTIDEAREILDLRGQIGSAQNYTCDVLSRPLNDSASIPSFLMINQSGNESTPSTPKDDGDGAKQCDHSCKLILLDLSVGIAESNADIIAATAVASASQVAIAEDVGTQDHDPSSAATKLPNAPNRWDLLTTTYFPSYSVDSSNVAEPDVGTLLFVASTETGSDHVWHFSADGSIGEPTLHMISRSSPVGGDASEPLRLRGLQFCPQGVIKPRATFGILLVLAGEQLPSTVTGHDNMIACKADGGIHSFRGGLGLPGLTLSTKVATQLKAALLVLKVSAASDSASCAAPESENSTNGSHRTLPVTVQPPNDRVASAKLLELGLSTDATRKLDLLTTAASTRSPVQSSHHTGPDSFNVRSLSEEQTVMWLQGIVRSNVDATLAACAENRIDGTALAVMCGKEIPCAVAFEMMRNELKMGALGDRLRLFDEVRRRM